MLKLFKKERRRKERGKTKNIDLQKKFVVHISFSLSGVSKAGFENPWDTVSVRRAARVTRNDMLHTKHRAVCKDEDGAV
jgi:hypothetical protein